MPSAHVYRKCQDWLRLDVTYGQMTGQRLDGRAGDSLRGHRPRRVLLLPHHEVTV